MIFNRWESVSWRQLKTVYDLPEIDEKVSLFHKYKWCKVTSSTKCKNIDLTLKRPFLLIIKWSFYLFVSEAEITK